MTTFPMRNRLPIWHPTDRAERRPRVSSVRVRRSCRLPCPPVSLGGGMLCWRPEGGSSEGCHGLITFPAHNSIQVPEPRRWLIAAGQGSVRRRLIEAPHVADTSGASTGRPMCPSVRAACDDSWQTPHLDGAIIYALRKRRR